MPILTKSEDVEATNPIYDANIKNWRFWYAAYEGDKAFIDLVIKQHERESPSNWEMRVNEAEVFNYSGTIINTFSGFIGMANPEEALGTLSEDESFKQFKNDTDLHGTDYDVFWDNTSALASVYGFVGILVDKAANEEPLSQADEISKRIYPYYSLYTPENILDWKWEKDPDTARPILTYLKVKEHELSILVYTTEEWERWTKEKADDSEWTVTENGVNPHNEITFTWYVNYNVPAKPFLGLSDIRAISRLQAALTRDLSHGNEIVKYAAFPMMRKPMRIASHQPTEEDDTSGVTAILEFDPETPDAKPDWLEAKVKEPIEAVLSWDEKKEEEIYRAAALSAFYGTHTEARSGVALRVELRQLSAILNGKVKSRNNAETQSLRYWRLWKDLPADESLDVSRPLSISVDELSLVLDNLITVKPMVRSELFKQAVEKRLVKLILENASDEEIAAIEEEIDNTQIPTVTDFIEDEDGDSE